MDVPDNDLGLPQRFWAKVRTGDGLNTCWEWTGSRSSGYGDFGVRPGVIEYAHRLVLEGMLGRKIAAGKETLHACDNRACVRPDHLSEGTRRENVRDCRARGRFRLPVPPDNRGEAHGMAKLTEEKVRWILGAPGRHSVIARAMGVSRSTVSGIKRGSMWKHLSTGRA